MRIAMYLLLGLTACGAENVSDGPGAHVLTAFRGSVDARGIMTLQTTAPDFITEGTPGQSQHASFEPGVLLETSADVGPFGACPASYTYTVNVTAQAQTYACNLEAILETITATAGACPDIGGSTLFASAPWAPAHAPSTSLGYDNVFSMPGTFTLSTPKAVVWTFAGGQNGPFSFTGYVLAPDGC